MSKLQRQAGSLPHLNSLFARKGKVFLLVEQSESDKIIPGMAFAFDIKSVSPESAVVLGCASSRPRAEGRQAQSFSLLGE